MHSVLRQRSPHCTDFRTNFPGCWLQKYILHSTSVTSHRRGVTVSCCICPNRAVLPPFLFHWVCITVAYMSDGCKLEVNSNAILKKCRFRCFRPITAITVVSRYRERDYGITGLISGLALLLGLSICRTLLLSAPP